MRSSLVVVVVLLAAFAATACGDAEKMETLQREKTSLEAKVKRLEAKVAKLETEAKPKEATVVENKGPTEAQLDSQEKCKKDLADCTKRVQKCEKDPFTGTKYLSGEEGQSDRADGE